MGPESLEGNGWVGEEEEDEEEEEEEEEDVYSLLLTAGDVGDLKDEEEEDVEGEGEVGCHDKGQGFGGGRQGVVEAGEHDCVGREWVGEWVGGWVGGWVGN